MTSVTAIRPYEGVLRERVFTLLRRAGLEIRDEDILPRGLTDREVIEELQRRRPDVLLVPVNVHRDPDGAMLNGLDLIETIDAEIPALANVPAIMPASIVALPAAHLRLSSNSPRPLKASLRERVLVLDESDLESTAALERVRAHLASWVSKFEHPEEG